jgi:Icc protein
MTLATPLDTSCLSILQLSDTHILASTDAKLLGVNTAYYFQAVLSLAFANNAHYDLVMLTGDLAQDPLRASYVHVLEQMAAYQIPCVCLPGNHDDYAVMQSVLATDWVNCAKQTLLGNWQVIALNSQIIDDEGGFLSDAELGFLENCLQQYPERHALVAVHHHCLPTGSVWMDTMMIDNSTEFLAMAKRYPQVKAIVNGHIHQVMDAQVNGLRVLGTPSTCFQFKPGSVRFALDNLSPAYRRLDLYADGSLNTEVIRIAEPLQGLENRTSGY